MSSGSRRRAHAKYATKQVAISVLRAGLASDRFTFIKICNERMDVTHKRADERTQLAIYEVIWDFSQRIARRSPALSSIQGGGGRWTLLGVGHGQTAAAAPVEEE